MTPARTPLWRRLLAATLALLMSLAGWPLAAHAQVRLPSLGETASQDLSVGAERKIGDSIMREARRDPEFLDDPVLQEYLLSIFNPLVAAARQLGNIEPEIDHAFAWEPFLVLDRSVNAFALPGGFIGVHLGMIAITTTPDQLASVLAHELSHVTQRHIARSIAPQQRASVVAIAAMLLGIIAASRANNVDVANAAIMGGQGAAIQTQLNFSRDVEREADRVGFGVLTQAGYAPGSMASMFEKLDVATRINDSGGFPYLRTHPLTGERISEARNRTLLGGGVVEQPTLLHGLMKVRARVLMAEGNLALQRLAGAATSPLRAERIVTLYGSAMAKSRLNDHAGAEADVEQALALAPEAQPREPRAERALRLLQAEVRLARADPAGALQALDAIPAPEHAERPPLLLRAQAQLDLRRRQPAAGDAALRESTEALQTWLVDHPRDGAAWELAAASSEALGLKLRAMRAGAEARAVVGDFTGAIDRLRAAQAASRSAGAQDFIEASVIDTRLRQLSAQRRQLQLEARGDSRAPGRPDEELPPQ